MSIVAKVFVVINLILSVVFLSFTVALYSKRAKYQELYEQQTKKNLELVVGWKDDINNLNETVAFKNRRIDSEVMKVEKLGQELKNSEQKIAKLEFEKSLAKHEQIVTSTQLMDAQREVRRLASYVGKAKSVIMALRQALVISEANETLALSQKADMEERFNQLNEKSVALQKDRQRLEQNLDEMRAYFEKLIALGYDPDRLIGLGEKVATHKIDGRVLAVDESVNLVTLSVGSDDLVKKGYVFTIWRGNKYVGAARVAYVHKNAAGAEIIPEQTPDKPKVGDMASTR